jgi:hypothetical protein
MERRKWQEKWQAQCAELEAIFRRVGGGSLEAINKIDRARMIINHNDINNYVNYV